jgi:PTH1 family peptidyl-tRNA hydrolase
MGIGKPQHKGEVASYVLSAFSSDEEKCLDKWIEKASDSIEFLLINSLDKTRAKYSQKGIDC